MTDDLEPAEHSPQNDETKEAKLQDKWKRGKWKEAINRTRTKIAEKVREEKEARIFPFQSDKERPGTQPNNDIDSFLAAGRGSTASSTRPSLHSIAASTENVSILNDSSTSSRPSTSDSKSQPSPKRVQVPRIDVSASQRFPNAKELGSSGSTEHPSSSALRSAGLGSALLKPEFKTRSQSAISVGSAARKARIRGLSVGFADTPPVIIGEGGDEAEAPPVEISRAKTRRARSASPQARSQFPNANMQSEARNKASGRGVDSPIEFVPKSFTRAQTGGLSVGTKPHMSQDVNNDEFVPKPFTRQQTGLSDTDSSATAQKPPPLPPRRKQEFLPHDLGRPKEGTLDLTREFEMTLGLTSSKPGATKSPSSGIQEPHIFAPKPQRAPPSYEIIEGSRREHSTDQRKETPLQQAPSQVTQQAMLGTDAPRQSHSEQQVLPQKLQQMPQHTEQPPSQRVQPASGQNMQQHMPPQTDLSQIHPISQPVMRPQQEHNENPRPPTQQRLQPDENDQVQRMQQRQQDIQHPIQPRIQQQQTPSPTFSRFASLHYPQPHITKHPPIPQSLPQREQFDLDEPLKPSTPKILSPIVTNREQGTYRSFAERTQANSRPTSLVDSPASGSPHTTNLRQESPPARYVASPSTHSSAVGNLHSLAEHPAAKMRFYESINKGNPPAGFI